VGLTLACSFFCLPICADAAAVADAAERSTDDRFLEFSFRGAIPLSLSSFSLCTEVSELLCFF
jgi:hypothetical protein